MGADSIAVDVPLLQGRELTISGIFRYAHTFPAALQLISSGRVDVSPVITHRFRLADTDAAMTLARREPHAIKAVVSPHP
jgi:L-iditol 2-dehydrogenase